LRPPNPTASGIVTSQTLTGVVTLQQGGPNASAYAWYLPGSTGQTPPQVLTYAFSVNENQDVTPTPIESVAPQTTTPLWPTGANPNLVSTNASSNITINAFPDLSPYGSFAFWFLATPNQRDPTAPYQPITYSESLTVAPQVDLPVAIAYYVNCPFTCGEGRHVTNPGCAIPVKGICTSSRCECALNCVPGPGRPCPPPN
jgi:hypothetical protein